MNATEATCGRERRPLKQTALPLPFAVRAARSTRPISTGLQPADALDPHHPAAEAMDLSSVSSTQSKAGTGLVGMREFRGVMGINRVRRL